MSRYHVYVRVRKLTWYFIGVDIIHNNSELQREELFNRFFQASSTYKEAINVSVFIVNTATTTTTTTTAANNNK